MTEPGEQVSRSAIRWFVILVVVLTTVRFYFAATMELLPEEAYYWTYAQHPALGYFDHPPMVAWSVKLGTLLCGDSELGVRLSNLVFWLGTLGLLWWTGKMWFGEPTALIAALLFISLPVFSGIGVLTFPDGALVFFWALTLFAISKALMSQRGSWWLLAGVGFGGAMLSKYYAVLLAPSLLIFLLRAPTHRVWLRRPHLWIACAIAAALFSPVIVWNAQHEWASFLFQTSRTSDPDVHAVRNFGMFWLYQLFVLTPWLLPLFVWAAARGIRHGWLRGEDRWNFAVSFSLPLFLLFLKSSLKTNIHINWTAPAYLSLALAAAATWTEIASRARGWRNVGWVSLVLSIIMGLVLLCSFRWGVLSKVFEYRHAGGWRDLARVTDEARRELSQSSGQSVFLIGADKYNLAAELGFYLRCPAETVNTVALCAQGLGYRYWTDLKQFEGRNAVIVSRDERDRTMSELRAHFDKLGKTHPVEIYSVGGKRRPIYLTDGYGYHARHTE